LWIADFGIGDCGLGILGLAVVDWIAGSIPFVAPNAKSKSAGLNRKSQKSQITKSEIAKSQIASLNRKSQIANLNRQSTV
jgi:hypothetical protein